MQSNHFCTKSIWKKNNDNNYNDLNRFFKTILRNVIQYGNIFDSNEQCRMYNQDRAKTVLMYLFPFNQYQGTKFQFFLSCPCPSWGGGYSDLVWIGVLLEPQPLPILAIFRDFSQNVGPFFKSLENWTNMFRDIFVENVTHV